MRFSRLCLILSCGLLACLPALAEPLSVLTVADRGAPPMTMEVTFIQPFALRGVDQVRVSSHSLQNLTSMPDFKGRLTKTLKLTCEAPGESVSNQLQHDAEFTFVAFHFGHFASTPVSLSTLQEQQSLDLTFKDPKGQAVTGYELEHHEALASLAREAKRGGLPPPQFLPLPNPAEVEAELQAVADALNGR